MSRSSSRSLGPNATGGTQKPPLTRPTPLRVTQKPVPAHIALVKAVLAKRHALSSYERMAFENILGTAVKRPLGSNVLAWLDRVAARINAQPVASWTEPTSLSFGPLPLKPPGA